MKTDHHPEIAKSEKEMREDQHRRCEIGPQRRGRLAVAVSFFVCMMKPSRCFKVLI